MTRKTKTVLYSAVFMITAISMVVLCYLKGIVPFGSKGSMAIMDAREYEKISVNKILL